MPKEDEEVKATGKRRRVRYGASDEDDEEEEENEEEEEAGMQVEQAPGQLPMGAQADSTGRFGGNQKVEEERERRWKREKRVTGSVFAVEDVLYADGELGEGEKEDYAQCVSPLLPSLSPLVSLSTAHHRDDAKPALTHRCHRMVLDLIEETDWKRRKKAGRPNSAPDPEPDLEEDDNEPSTTASASVALNKPQLRKGCSTQETKLGELELVRTGHPYWFLTEGNVEIVWSIEEIRFVFPLPVLPVLRSHFPVPQLPTHTRPRPDSTCSIKLPLSPHHLPLPTNRLILYRSYRNLHRRRCRPLPHLRERPRRLRPSQRRVGRRVAGAGLRGLLGGAASEEGGGR